MVLQHILLVKEHKDQPEMEETRLVLKEQKMGLHHKVQMPDLQGVQRVKQKLLNHLEVIHKKMQNDLQEKTLLRSVIRLQRVRRATLDLKRLTDQRDRQILSVLQVNQMRHHKGQHRVEKTILLERLPIRSQGLTLLTIVHNEELNLNRKVVRSELNHNELSHNSDQLLLMSVLALHIIEALLATHHQQEVQVEVEVRRVDHQGLEEEDKLKL